MNKLWNDIKVKMLQSGSKLGLLIGINVAVFLLVNIFATLERWFLQSTVLLDFSRQYLQLSAYLPQLAKHFWTPITYMFLHADVFHILFNMLWLFWMGQIFEEYLGNKRTLTLYFLGGLAGALFFVVAYNLIPYFASQSLQGATVIGASAGVMAIVIGTATLLPDYTIFLMFLGPVRLKWLAIAYVLIDFLGTVGPNGGGSIAHLGGALMGFVYIKQLRRGNDWSKPLNNLFKSKPAVKIVSKNTQAEPFKSNNTPRQEEIDRILDKISHSGYDSLSKQEKETLFRASSSNDR